MNLTLKVWRQADADAKGKMETYKIDEVSPDMSFLEMMDVLNEHCRIESRGGQFVSGNC
jgi:succinate dehydrogenase / fumarate reductase iron-sulfur subunit